VPVPSALASPIGDSSKGEPASGILAVGEVNYDSQAKSSESPPVVGSLVGTRAATGGKGPRFGALAATGPEIAAVERAFVASHPRV